MDDATHPAGPVPSGAVVVDPVSGEVQLDVVVAGADSGRGRWIVLRLLWDPQDPLSVGLFVSARPDHPALPRGQWVVLRDFLRYGLDEPTGDGDVRIRPEVATPNGSRGPGGQPPQRGLVWFELARAGRPCCLAVPAPRLAEFLDATERVVPVGEERSEALVDEFIARLLKAT